MNKKQLLLRLAVALVSLTVTLSVYVTHLIYFNQREYFAHYFLDLIIQPVIMVAVVGLALFLVFALFPRFILKFITSILLIAAILFWFHSDLFVISYGVLDGSKIDFSMFDKRGNIELAIGSLALLLALIFQQFVNRHFAFIVGIILFAQVLLVGVKVIEEPEDKVIPVGVDQEFYKYSSEKNIIIIILDTFGAEYFHKILERNPEFKDMYQGFVSYRDAISNYPATKGSLPSLLTGQMIPKDAIMKDFIEYDVGQKGMPAVFEQNGYDVSVISTYSWFKNFYPRRFLFEPPLDPEQITRFNGALLLDYALFRLAPHILKKRVYNNGLWLISNYLAFKTELPATQSEQAHMFLDLMTEQSEVGDDNPRFKLIHILTPHPPFVYDENCVKRAVSNSMSGDHLMMQQSLCALKKTNELLQKYKEIGVYDNSVIIVASDHGSRMFDDRSLTGFPSYFEMNSAGIMFMIKGMEQNGKFKEVDQPFSLLELYSNITNPALHATSYDEMFDQNRLFYSYRNNAKGGKRMINDGALYRVNADYRNKASWELKELIANGCQPEEFPLQMTFSSNARAHYCARYGFGLASSENDGVLAESVDSRITFKINTDVAYVDNEFSLALTFKPFLFERQQEINLLVYLNNSKIGEILVNQNGEQTHQFDFSGELFVSTGLQELKMLMPDLKPVKQFDLSSGSSVLGVVLKSVLVSQKEP